jgi:hypothetical protein
LALGLAAGGCGLRLHQSDQAAAARDARALTEVATRGTDRIWESLSERAGALEAVERAAIERAVGPTDEAGRREIATWDWHRMRQEAERVLADDAGSVAELAGALAALRVRAHRAGDELVLEILPQLAAGAAWPVDEMPTRRTLQEMGLLDVVARLQAELGDEWPDPASMELLLERLGLSPEERAPAGRRSAAGKLRQAGRALEEALGTLRVLTRRAIQEPWPLDEAIRLLRQSDQLDLYFGRPLAEAEPLPPEIRARLARVGRIVERRPVEWWMDTPAQLRAHLAHFDAAGEMVGRRFQRDVLTTRAELLAQDLELMGRQAHLWIERLELLDERTEAVEAILGFIDGPLGEVRLGARAATADDSVFVTVRQLVEDARASAAGFAVVPAAAAEGVAAMQGYTQRVAAAARAVDAAAAVVRLRGELRVRAELARLEGARMEREAAVERARIAALGWKRLLDDGARGLEAYWQGGVRGEDLILLIFIARDVVTSGYKALR